MNIYANSKSDKRPPLWIIGGLPRDSKEKKLITFRIEAETEKEARRLVAPTHVCFFAGCIRH
ncbi:host cell division inhibitor Icd-like protein [Salmonella enterica]|nr:host cell division inhibitor Icd-like protein [Salmonella enterica]